MSILQYRILCREERNRLAEKVKQTLSFHSPGGCGWRKPDEVCAETGESERAKAVRTEIQARKTVLYFCILFERVLYGSPVQMEKGRLKK